MDRPASCRQSAARLVAKWVELSVNQRCSLLSKIVHRLLLLTQRLDLADLVPLVEPQVSEKGDPFKDHRPLDRVRYEESCRESLGEDERPRLFLERVRHLVVDPTLPHPQGERLEKLRNAWREVLAEHKLQLGRGSTREDHFFSDAVATIAAWMPEEGAEVVRRQMEDLPLRFKPEVGDKVVREDRHWWVFSIRRHVVLAEGAVREALSAAANTAYSGNSKVAPGFCLLSLLPGMTPVAIVHTILHHSLSFEWSLLYETAAYLDIAGLHLACSEILDQVTTPRERTRVYSILIELGDGTLSKSQRQYVRRDIEEGDSDLYLGALGVAVACDVRDIQPDRLLAVALDREENSKSKTFGPDHAAWLLIQDGHFLDRLPPYWRAVGAVVHSARREQLLTEIEDAFGVGGGGEEYLRATYTLPFRKEVRPKRWKFSLAEEDRRTIVLGESASDLGGLKDDVWPADLKEFFNEDLHIEKWNNLVQSGLDILQRRREEHRTAWSSEQVPQELVDALDEPRFERWVEVLLRDPRQTWYDWMGLVIPLFRRALSRGNEVARRLWDFVNPLPHQRGPGGIQYLEDGIDWVFHELSRPQANEDLAREFLRTLILDARTDQQLFEIALGARCQEQWRLLAVVDELLKSQDAEVRARSARLLGWLEGTQGRLRDVELADASLWGRGIAEDALKNRHRESFALHWLGRFLRQDLTREQRWGAGQLFLESVDGSFEAWAYRFLREAAPDVRARGEALLLLDAARDEVKQRRSGDLEKYFLGIKVSDLESGCHPWRRQRSWQEIERRW